MQVKKTAGIALVAATALVLGACGGGNASKNGASGDKPALPGSDVTRVDRAKLKQGGNLNLALSSKLTQFLYGHAEGTQKDNATLFGYAMPNNWIVSEKGEVDVNPDYLTKYEMKDKDLPAGTAMEITLDLNPKGVWNDGTPITWEDYEATWKAWLNEKNNVASRGGWTEISSISKGKDEYQVKIDFSNPYPDWMSTLNALFAKKSIDTPEKFKSWTDPTKELKQYGAGPFIVDSWNAGTGDIIMKRNDKWWGKPALLDTISFRVLDTQALPGAFASGQIDVYEGIANAAQYETAKKRKDADIKMSASTTWRHFTFNAAKGSALEDPALRKAIFQGVNTKEIIASDLAGLPYAKLDISLGNHIFLPGQIGYEDHAIKYDPEAAKKTLEDAGYKKNGEFYEKDGKRASFAFSALTGVPASENEAAILKDQMKEIGVEVKVQNTPRQDFGPVLDQRKFQSIAFSWIGTLFPMGSPLNQVYGSDGGSNFTGQKLPELDKLFNQIKTTLNQDERRKLANEADKKIWEAGMNLPLYYRPALTGVRKDLANIGATQFETFLPENIGFMK